ncbi:uncharacterized protein METZ01_LOCUS55849 [marine metagenome]|uniref:Uncharacterized protein n=1 Tax=marine metagenome TaxID=408172 RepID=A0A381SFZ8_9ZZZZ
MYKNTEPIICIPTYSFSRTVLLTTIHTWRSIVETIDALTADHYVRHNSPAKFSGRIFRI